MFDEFFCSFKNFFALLCRRRTPRAIEAKVAPNNNNPQKL
jgi:hypothetical protein